MAIHIFMISHRTRTMDKIQAAAALSSQIVPLGQASEVKEVQRKAFIYPLDLFVCDFELSEDEAAATVVALRRFAPRARILLLLDVISPTHVSTLLKAGADGILSSDATPPDLLQTITAIHAGKSVVPASVLSTLLG